MTKHDSQRTKGRGKRSLAAITTGGILSALLLASPAGAADQIASNVPTCKGFLQPETGSWFSEKVRTGDLHASLVPNKSYTVGNAYQVQLWSGGKWNAGFAIIHNFDKDGVCEVRAANVP